MNEIGRPCAVLPCPDRGFVSSQPARTWEEGLLCGNGTIGANAMGRPLDERIIFTHERLFWPMGPPPVPADQSSRLPEIRHLIERGEYQRAVALQFELSGLPGFRYPEFFVPAFDLTIRSRNDGPIRDYRRSVDFQTGEAVVRWADNRGVFERRLFVSRADRVAVLLIVGPGRRSLDCVLALEPREPSDHFNADSDIARHSDEMFREHVTDVRAWTDGTSLWYSNRYRKAYPGSLQSIVGYAHILPTGGDIEALGGGSLAIRQADRVLVLLDLRPVFDPHTSPAPAMPAAIAALPAEYDELRRRHARLHGELFNRVRLDLRAGEGRRRTTESLIAESTCEHTHPALIEKVFDAGRYNIISSTGELPPNLQGVWGGTYVPDWASDYTHNGNLPCAIAALLPGNLPELMHAYTNYIEWLIPWLEINAKRFFGARGVVLPSHTSTHGLNTALSPTFAGGFWVAGAGWAAHFFYDYYLYTGDRRFLAEHALPFMLKVVEFFEDFLFEGPDGKWVFSPGQSPENTPGNSNSQGTFNATMDVAVVKELLYNTIAASRELGCHADRIPHWQRMLEKMPDYMVDERGVVKEWLTPRLENNDRHRHSSHLYALFDGRPEEIAENPRLRAAFAKSIEVKLDTHWRNNPTGVMSFGLVQLGLAAASLGEGELAWRCLAQLVNRYWLNNLASTHNHRSLFNMDISGGLPALILRMLVASDPGRLTLLPALPKAWPAGVIEGVLCRGQIEIRRLEWAPAGLECWIRSGKAQTIALEVPAGMSSVEIDGVRSGFPTVRSDRECDLTLPAHKSVIIKILFPS